LPILVLTPGHVKDKNHRYGLIKASNGVKNQII